jgi:hypothetical protein
MLEQLPLELIGPGKNQLASRFASANKQPILFAIGALEF